MPISPGPVLPPDVTAYSLAPGPLDTPAIWRLLLVLAAVLVWLAFRPRARTGPPRAARLVTAAALIGLAGAFWLNSYVGYVRTPHDLGDLLARGPGPTGQIGSVLAAATDPDDDYLAGARAALRRDQRGGDGLQVRTVALPDPARGVPGGTAYVLLPPGYDDPANAAVRYPVVYLIHGYPDGHAQDWFTAGDALGTVRLLLADHLIKPMIIVSPDMTAEQPSTDWECLNVPGGPQLEDYLVHTVVPGVDQRFRTRADRGDRALGGMSGGAYCALNIGLHHVPDFGTLLLTLPYDELGDSAGILAGHPALLAANDPRRDLPTTPFPDPVNTIVVAGQGAPTDVDTANRLAGLLAARGQPVALTTLPGENHTWRTARAALPYLLVYADEHLHPAPPARITAPPPVIVVPKPAVHHPHPHRRHHRTTA